MKKNNSQPQSKDLLFLAQKTGAEIVNLDNIAFTETLLSSIPTSLAQQHGALPIAVCNRGVTVALQDPLNSQVLSDLRFTCRKDIQLAVAPPEQIQQKIQEHYGKRFAQRTTEKKLRLDADSPPAELFQSPVVRYIHTLLENAIAERASDLHLEASENGLRVRVRIDGILQERAPAPENLTTVILARLKVMAHLDIAETRLPQDGRIFFKTGNRTVDLRLSTVPMQFGESAVIRILDREHQNLQLNRLGMNPSILHRVEKILQKPHGIFIATGPTGSGKTTTLYACLHQLRSSETKILTAEDPVEYELDGVQQIQTHDAIGLNFANLLRSFLRHDPDKILVGEIRDAETAQMAIQASLTGHLVLTSLHTRDSAGALTRLIDMGVEPFLVSASLTAVLAQRLARNICPDCKHPTTPPAGHLHALGLSAEENTAFHRGKGCAKCRQTGYQGRTGIFELLEITPSIGKLIEQKAPSHHIRETAVGLGMKTLREEALRACLDGQTTTEEVLRIT